VLSLMAFAVSDAQRSGITHHFSDRPGGGGALRAARRRRARMFRTRYFHDDSNFHLRRAHHGQGIPGVVAQQTEESGGEIA
jgi:hypothetical protein